LNPNHKSNYYNNSNIKKNKNPCSTEPDRKMKTILETIKNNQAAILTIVIVSVCTIIGAYFVMKLMFGVHLLQDPCDLCESFQAAQHIPLNITQLNGQLNIPVGLGDCVGPVQVDMNESHFRNTCEYVSLSD